MKSYSWFLMLCGALMLGCSPAAKESEPTVMPTAGDAGEEHDHEHTDHDQADHENAEPEHTGHEQAEVQKDQSGEGN